MCASWHLAVILVALTGSHQTPVLPGDFTGASQTTKIRALNDIATSRTEVPIGEVITLVGFGLRDTSAAVRVAAFAAVMGRAMAARWAGTSGPALGPAPRGVPPPERRIIPADWKGDADNSGTRSARRAWAS